jgi:hypothetical protein
MPWAYFLTVLEVKIVAENDAFIIKAIFASEPLHFAKCLQNSHFSVATTQHPLEIDGTFLSSFSGFNICSNYYICRLASNVA